MRRIREVLRLRAELGPNVSAIAAGARLARSTVRAYLDRAAAAGVDAAAAELLLDGALEAALFRPALAAPKRALPDWAVKSLRSTTPISRPITTPLGFSPNVCRSWVRGSLGAVGKWPAGATAESLAQAGHLSIA